MDHLYSTAVLSEDGKHEGGISVAEVTYRIDPVKFVSDLDADQQAALLNTLAEAMPASEFIEAFEDRAANAVTGEDGKLVQPLIDNGTVILDCFVERARHLGRLPDDWETPAMLEFGGNVDRLHEAICDGRRQDACDLLREMVPDHAFMSDAARQMLAEQRGKAPVATSLFPEAAQ